MSFWVCWMRSRWIFEALGKDAMQCGGEGRLGFWWLGLNLLAAGNVEMQLAVRNLPLPPLQPLHKPPLEPPTASYEPNPVPVERPSDHEQPWKGKKRGRRNFQTADTFKSCWFKDLEFSNPWWHTNKEHLTTSSVPEEEKLRNKLVPIWWITGNPFSFTTLNHDIYSVSIQQWTEHQRRNWDL